jgi:hypothetical protein
MAGTLSTAARNAACNAVVDLADAGSGAGKLKIFTSGAALLVSIPLSDPAFGNAGASVAGRADGAGLPLSAAATGAGVADNAAITDSDDTVIISGTLAAMGVTLDNTNIAVGQNVSVSTLNHTQPAS